MLVLHNLYRGDHLRQVRSKNLKRSVLNDSATEQISAKWLFVVDYKFLGVMKRQFAGVPILGLTATATDNVVQDVKKILNIPNCLQFRASFNRDNLYYEVTTLEKFDFFRNEFLI